MKLGKYIKSIDTILPVFGLVVLLLVSPCKVRNLVQSELGFPQTEVGNKGKTSFSSTNCSDLLVTNNILNSKKPSSQQLLAVTTEDDVDFRVTTFTTKYIHPVGSLNHTVSTVPYYILYQNFKDYL